MLNQVVGQRPGLKLQPNFVEWMMGFPLNWTDLSCQKQDTESKGLKPSETQSSPKSPNTSEGGF
jgi:hypothetical protein